MTKRNKVRITRSISYVLLALIWGVVLSLLFEFSALLYQVYVEHNNPLITAFRNGISLPPTTHDVIIKKVACYSPEKIGGWNFREDYSENDTLIQDYLKSGLQISFPSQTNADDLHYKFAAYDNDTKEAYTALNAKFVLFFDKKSCLKEKYGAYKNLFEGYQGIATRTVMRRNGDWGKILATIQEANHQGAVRETQILLPAMQMIMLPVTAYCFPYIEDQNGNYVFIEMHPEHHRNFMNTLMPSDSRWDIPYYRYKENTEETFQTNKLGFRSKEIASPKPADVFRILCLGGSTTEEGADNEHTYPALLEARLHKRFPDNLIEVINAGTSGISSDWHLLRISEYLSVEPDMVILHLGINDIWRQYNSQWAFNLLGDVSYSFRLFTRYLCKNRQSIYFSNQIQYTGVCLDLITRLLQEKGVAVAFASIASPDPDKTTRQEQEFYTFQADHIWKLPLFSLHRYHQEITQSNSILKAISQDRHAFYIPVAERLPSEAGANIFKDFCHLTQRGIEVKADIIYDCIGNVLENYYKGKRGEDTAID